MIDSGFDGNFEACWSEILSYELNSFPYIWLYILLNMD